MIASEYDELDRELGSLDREAGPASAGLRILPIVIAVVALVAIVGIVWYAYSQGVREGSETAAPLLRPDGPAKTQPDDPGGREIAGTDLDVYERIDGDEPVTARAERILPPPEEPLTPPSEPAAPEAPAALQTEILTDDGLAQDQMREPIPEPALPDPTLAAPEAPPPTVEGVTEQVAAAPAAEPAVPAEPAAPAAEEVIAAPEEPAAPEAPAEAAAPQTASSAGTGWRIQIAALRTRAAAESEWAQRQAALPQLLGSLALGVQEVDVNGTTYFRVRGGPLSDRDAAKALCDQLKAQGLDCIPVAPDS